MDGTQRTQRDLADQTVLEETIDCFYKGIVQNSHVGLIVDSGGTVRFMNPAAEKLFDCTLEGLAGLKLNFDLPSDEPFELEVKPPGKEPRIAEVRVAQVQCKGETLYVATLFDVTEHVQLREGMRALSLVDELTGLYNRRGFITLAQQQMKVSNRTRKGMLVIFSDLDRLKWVNDAFGHRAGDLALIETAGILKETFRDSDIIARIAGDEFAVIAMEANKDSAEIIATRLHQKMDESNARGQRGYNLSISVGIAFYNPEKPCSIDELLDEADILMYQHKWSKYNSEIGRPQLPG